MSEYFNIFFSKRDKFRSISFCLGARHDDFNKHRFLFRGGGFFFAKLAEFAHQPLRQSDAQGRTYDFGINPKVN